MSSQATKELEGEELGLDEKFIIPQIPKAKSEHAAKVIQDFSNSYADMDNVISLIQRDKQRLKQEEQASPQETPSEEKSLDREKNELDRAIASIAQVRSIVDILKALYAMEKALYELRLATKKPNTRDYMQQIQDSKHKPLTANFLKESLRVLKSSKEKIQEFAKHLQLERAFAKELRKDIAMLDLVESKESKAAYIKQIDKKLCEAREKFPSLEQNYPKMLQAATSAIKQPLQEFGKNALKTMPIGL